MNDVLVETSNRDTWRVPPLSRLERPAMSRQRKVGLLTLRLIAFVLVVVEIVEVAVG